jgi:hypothetical protein
MNNQIKVKGLSPSDLMFHVGQHLSVLLRQELNTHKVNFLQTEEACSMQGSLLLAVVVQGTKVCQVNGGGKESRGGRGYRGKKGEGGRDRTTEADEERERACGAAAPLMNRLTERTSNENDFDRGRLD